MKNAFFMLSISIIVPSIVPSMVLGQWVQTNRLSSGPIHSLVVNGENLYAGTEGAGVFLSTDDGVSWISVSKGLTNMNVLSLAVNGTYLFAGTDGNGVLRSALNDIDWIEVNEGLTYKVIKCVAVMECLFAGGMDGVWRSTNNGTNWAKVGGDQWWYVNCFASNVMNLFLGARPEPYIIMRRGGVWYSVNNGETWTQAGYGLEWTNINCLIFNGTKLFAGTDDRGVFLSKDNGASWSSINEGLTDSTVYSLAVCGTNIFVGTAGDYSGVCLSSDDGTSWMAVNEGLTSSCIRSLACSKKYLFAGTQSGRLWRRPLSEMITSIEKQPMNLPAQINLKQNYPNPFNPSTTIEFEIPTSEYVSLKVFNAMGQEVATLIKKEQSAGIHNIRWNAAGLASGVYLYRLQAGKYTETKKLILLR